MKKNVNLCIDLKTLMQEDVMLCKGMCYRGVLTRTEEHEYLFEECVPMVRHYHPAQDSLHLVGRQLPSHRHGHRSPVVRLPQGACRLRPAHPGNEEWQGLLDSCIVPQKPTEKQTSGIKNR